VTTAKQDIIKAAIQFELDGRKFYRDAAGRASNDMARQMFESLADDELIHIEWIEKFSAEEKTAEEVKKNTYERLRGIFADAPETEREAAAASSDDIEAMKLAIKMEEKSRDAYLKWAQDSDTHETVDLCNILADQEAFHRELLENTINYLEHTGDWFMAEEGWHFDGG
jgi:rubrerythrin